LINGKHHNKLNIQLLCFQYPPYPNDNKLEAFILIKKSRKFIKEIETFINRSTLAKIVGDFKSSEMHGNEMS